MSSEFQNRVRKNLEQAPPAQHPSADVLSAYAEHALRAPEEKEVLAHLAVCTDCREVVYLASEAEEVPATPVPSLSNPRRFRWWTWAVPVTAVLVVASVYFVQGPMLKEPQRAELAKPAQTQPQPPQSTDQFSANTAPPAATPGAKTATAKPGSSVEPYIRPVPATAPERKQAADLDRFSDNNLGGLTTETRHERQKENEAPLNIAGGRPQNVPAAPPPPPVALEKDKKAEAQTNGYSAAAPAAANTAVEVTSEPQSEVAEIAGSRDSQNLQTLKTAKQRPDTNQPGLRDSSASTFARGANTVAPAWSVSADGRVHHLVNGARQPIAIDPAAHFLVVTSVGKDIWAGGKNLVLYHSSDNGATWQRQSIPAQVPADIIRLQATDAVTVTLTTSRSQSFTTNDAGATWTPSPK